MRRREQRSEQRQTAAQTLAAAPGALLRTRPSLPRRVRLEQQRNLSGAGYKQVFKLVVQGSSEFSDGGYPVTAVIAACIAKMDGRTALGDIIAAVNAENRLDNADGLRRIVERDLPALIGAGLIDAALQPLGRNDPCPCGSGKKYKRCHGR